MFCPECGTNLREGALFCSECGKAIQTVQSQPEHCDVEPQETMAQITQQEEVKPEESKINRFIAEKGADKLSNQLSLVTIVAVILMRFLGFVTALLVAAVNGYLIYRSYKDTGSFNKKMIAWCVGALLIWAIYWIVPYI